MADRAGKPAPRLARLDLHGFKSFATRTVLVFEPGITAVVGPNGSGKSNIADAVRWVLGETSHSALRSKRTDDVVFAGGKGRAPAGLAEVTVTFNNEDGWLPSEFTEVTVTRRAYRGGENQYFLNGRRVRLKDVTQLTATLGQSYTVVGQGLVDAALSQRADERRGLFEHAADLAGLRLKVAEAERNLNEADANTARLNDLLIELQPRLRSLERAARQAREWQSLHTRLRFLQHGHYRRLLSAAHDRFSLAAGAIAGDEQVIAGMRQSLDGKIAARATAQDDARAAAESLAQHDARLDVLREQARRTGHERDLVAERLAALDRRRTDMLETRAGLDDQVARVEADLARARTSLDDVQGEVAGARTEVERLDAEDRGAQHQVSGVENEIADLARTIGRQERLAADLGQRLALLDQQRESGTADDARLQRESSERAGQVAQLETERAAFEAEDARIAASIATLDTRLATIATAISQQEATVAAAGTALAEAERRHGQAANRLAVLQRLQDEGAGLHAGVRQVMQWHRQREIDGVRGTVAELVDVDATYDTAIEVALGGHLQDIVVDRWRDAETAIERLKQARTGRATFQPLDTLARRDQRSTPPAVANGAGLHGIAADLVTCEPEIEIVVRSLLGRIVVVDDLPAARRLLGDLPAGWSAVTLAGEIARAGGSVTGGSAVRESGVLGRERDLRELPDEISRLARRREDAETQRDDAASALTDLGSQRTAVSSERAGFIAQNKERAGERSRLDGWIGSLRSQQEQAERRAASLAAGRATLDTEIGEIESRRDASLLGLERLRDQHGQLLDRLASLRESLGERTGNLMQARQRLAALDERLRADERQVVTLQRQRQGQAEELAVRSQRLSELDGERAALLDQRERVEREVAQLTEANEAAIAERAPLAERVETAGNVVASLATGIDTLRQNLVDRERQMHQGSLAVERARADLGAIHQRIADDLDLETPDDLLTAPPPEHPDDWVLADDETEVERAIGRLRDRLRRVGYAGDDVVEEYERESAHLTHLTTQLADVTEAAKAIRAMLADLNETMQQRFEETFAKVAAAFGEAFTTLFGGGTARLVLTGDDETGAPGGIDIVAQPPGKRLQGLALLSGGERSLTAVALLFAILKVNPTPFVLLDEVDAALDEANVVRFRDELRRLADQTQAIVITHNRGTVEIADTLYGVTMGGDGVSQTLSLRLGDLPLDDEIDVRDLPAVSAGVPVR